MSKRRPGTAADMVRSMAVVVGLVVAVLLLGASRQLVFPTGNNNREVRTVSYAAKAAAAKSVAPADALAPSGLPGGWRATSARFTPDPLDLHIGFVTPRGRFAEVEETTGPLTDWLKARLGKAPARLEPVDVGGVTWQQRRTDRGELALVRTRGRATVLVTGNASLAELRVLAGSLR